MPLSLWVRGESFQRVSDNKERLGAMTKRVRWSLYGIAAFLLVFGLLAMLEWRRQQQAVSAGLQPIDDSGVALSADDLEQKYSNPEEFASLCKDVQDHFAAQQERFLKLQHLRKSRVSEFDYRNQPVAVVEMLDRVYFEGQKECKTNLETRQVFGQDFDPGKLQAGLNTKTLPPFSPDTPMGVYRYEWAGVETIAGRLVLRLNFEPVKAVEGTFKGWAQVDPASAEAVQMRGWAVKLPLFVDRVEMRIDYGLGENGHMQMRRAAMDVSGGFAIISRHYRIEAELSDYQPFEAGEHLPETQLTGVEKPSSDGTPVRNIAVWVVLALAAAGLLALTLPLLGCWSWKRRRLAALRAGSRIVQTARGPIEYAVTGEGPPLLVIHGGMGGYDQALGLGALINRHAGAGGFTVLAPSRPGYLRTPAQVGLKPADQADALAALLDQLGIAQVGVFAGSYGGPIALQFALRHPHRLWGLVLLAAITGRCTVGQQWPVSEKALLARPGKALFDFLHWLLYLWGRAQPLGLVHFFMRRMTAPSVSSTEIDRRIGRLKRLPDQVRTVQELFCSMTPISVQMVGSLNDEKQIACLPDYPVEDVRAPTLLIHGRDDCVGPGFASAEWVAGRIPGAQLFAVERCGHFMLAGEFVPDVFSASAEFLRRQAAGKDDPVSRRCAPTLTPSGPNSSR